MSGTEHEHARRRRDTTPSPTRLRGRGGGRRRRGGAVLATVLGLLALLALSPAVAVHGVAVAQPAEPGPGSVPATVTTREGIDVATTQKDLDFAAAARSGVSFAVVKAGGSQLRSGPYVSPYYTRQVDAARAAGLTVGHYWLSGDFQTPTAAADYFVDHLHDYRAGDVVALDDEVLDDSTRLWGDAEVAAFFTRVKQRLGTVVPWFYISASPLRSRSWTQTIATGAKLWVASYGRNDGTYPGAPDIGTAYPAWAAHQYTSVGRVGGVYPVDRDRALSTAFEPVTGGPTTPPLPKSPTQQDGVPETVLHQRMQHWLQLTQGYAGPIDGEPGPNTWRALQSALRQDYDYAGPVDGVMGPQSWKALQLLAQREGGYRGPLDGVMGPNSWRGVATFLNDDRWD